MQDKSRKNILKIKHTNNQEKHTKQTMNIQKSQETEIRKTTHNKTYKIKITNDK